MIDSSQFERDCLSSLIIAKDKQRARSIMFKLSVDMFASAMCKNIYTAIRELTEANEFVDIVSVAGRVSSNVTTGFDDFMFVADMVSESPCVESGLVSYAKRVRQSYYLRDAQNRVNEANNLIANLTDLTLVGELAGSINDIFAGLMLETNDKKPVKFKSLAKSYVEQLHQKLEGVKDESIVMTGIHDLDAHTGGFNNTDLIVLGGCPGSGKTELAVSVIRGITSADAEHGDKPGALMFSLEMSNAQLVERAVSGEAMLPVSKLRNPKDLNEQGWGQLEAALGNMVDNEFWMTDQVGLTVEDVITIATRHKQDHPNTKVFVVDYAGLLDLGKAVRHDLALGEVSRKLKLAAKELKTPFVLLTQLNSKSIDARPLNDRHPRASDIKDSSRIEDDADLILLCYRHKTYDVNAPDIAEIILAKARHAIKGAICYQRFINGHFYGIDQGMAANELSMFKEKGSAKQPKHF